MTEYVLVNRVGVSGEPVKIEGATVRDALEQAARDRLRITGLDLSGLDLTGADLSGASFDSCRLHGTTLHGADLALSAWVNCYAPGVQLTRADLGFADFDACTLRGADLRGARLRDAFFRDCAIWGAELGGANLRGSVWSDCAGLTSGEVFTFPAGPSGPGCLVDNGGTWRVSIGCWRDKALDELRDLVEDRADWPVAEGRERERRRPYLRAALALCEAHIAYVGRV